MQQIKSLVLAVSIDLLILVLQGYTLTFLWLWFIVPVFNQPKISTGVAMGILVTTSYLVGKVGWKDVRDSKPKDVFESIPYKIAIPVTWLGMGYIVHLFL